MLSLTTVSTTSPFSSPLKLLQRNTKVSKLLCSLSLTVDSDPDPDPDPSPQSVRGNHAGLRLEASVDSGSGKARIDSWIASRIQGVSRARVESSIRSGLVAVNGIPIHKVSHRIKEGDKISCIVSELRPLRAEPEDIPLDIVYEDAHVLVVNKPANMVVHPAPGNANTLVNAVLNHCKLPMVACSANKRSTETEEDIGTSDSEIEGFFIEESSVGEFKSENNDALVRPGIVHRLDKGTSGLLVIAKIRVHAKYLGVPLLGDELYGGTKGMALSLLKPRLPSSSHGCLSHVISILQRPCLHALSLGFTHPYTGEYMKFSCPPPDDFSEVLSLLRSFSRRSVVSADMEIDV